MVDGDLEAFWTLLAGLGPCMMTTRQDNALRSRPMAADIDPSTREIRFLTRLSTYNVDELAANPDVNLAFADRRNGSCVSISGQAYLTQDPHLIEHLWSAEREASLGLARSDPDIAVIRVVPARAEHWDQTGRLTGTWSLFKPRAPALEPASGPRGTGNPPA